MNVAPRYLGRGSWLARRDPRVLILVAILTAITVPQVWDLRIAIPLLVIAQVYYRAAAIPFGESSNATASAGATPSRSSASR